MSNYNMSAKDTHSSLKRLSEEDTAVSNHISQVLADIGVNVESVAARRSTFIGAEMAFGITQLKPPAARMYVFGSQSEGSTTEGLNSDIDQLCIETPLVVRFRKWSTLQEESLLVVKLKGTSPGYCCLSPYGVRRNYNTRYVNELGICHKLIVNRSFYEGLEGLKEQSFSYEIHGPACKLTAGKYEERDLIAALRSPDWPVEGNAWVKRVENKYWPTKNMKARIVNSGCFIVPVGHKQSTEADIEFRISTNMAERILMFSLNITQIRCLVLLKIAETRNVMKSFYCKTALFYAIEENGNEHWQEHCILHCLLKCLRWLLLCTKHNYIPHYFIPSLNMFEGRHDVRTRNAVCDTLQTILDNPLSALAAITIDNIGHRLSRYIQNGTIMSIRNEQGNTINCIGRFLFGSVGVLFNFVERGGNFSNVTFLNQVLSIINAKIKETENEWIETISLIQTKVACALCSILTSRAFERGDYTISPKALYWFRRGCHVDAASGRLKLATVLYMAGDFKSAKKQLDETEEYLDKVSELTAVNHECVCDKNNYYGDDYDTQNVEQFMTSGKFKMQTAHCVVFTREEQYCCPVELRYEIHKSRKQEYADEENRNDRACVHTFTYQYFLLFLTCMKLEQNGEADEALDILETYVTRENYPVHIETGLNLLGQCLEHINRPDEALKCYISSLQIRLVNNAANHHITRVLPKSKTTNYGHDPWEIEFEDRDGNKRLDLYKPMKHKPKRSVVGCLFALSGTYRKKEVCTHYKREVVFQNKMSIPNMSTAKKSEHSEHEHNEEKSEHSEHEHSEEK